MPATVSVSVIKGFLRAVTRRRGHCSSTLRSYIQRLQGTGRTQRSNTTQFLGIPVDGTRTAMIQKLKAKGFKTLQGVPDALTDL